MKVAPIITWAARETDHPAGLGMIGIAFDLEAALEIFSADYRPSLVVCCINVPRSKFVTSASDAADFFKEETAGAEVKS